MKKAISDAVPSKCKIKKTKSYPALVMSIVGMAICAFLLAPATLAWFGGSSGASLQRIQAADYDVSVVVTNDGTGIEPGTDGVYTLGAGEYKVVLTASGSAATGYCKVEAGDEKLYTAQIAPSGSLSFTLKTDGEFRVKFTPTWGTCSSTQRIAEGDNVTLSTPEPPAQSVMPEPAQSVSPEPPPKPAPASADPTPLSPAQSVVPEPSQSVSPEPPSKPAPASADPTPLSPAQSTATEPEQSFAPEPEQSVASEPEQSISPEPEQSVASEPPQSESSDHAASEIESSEVAASESEFSESATSESECSESATSDPASTESATSDPASTEPESSDAEISEPESSVSDGV